MAQDITQEVAGLTDRVIAARVVTTMAKDSKLSKFAELAARSSSIRKELDDRADALAKRLDAIPALADTAFAKHESILAEHEQGIQALEDSLRDLAGHNGAPLSDTLPPSVADTEHKS